MEQLDAMQIFVRVAELASFTQAADSLGLPKASVSGAVQNLEARLGTRLLHRTTRRVQLTQDGQVFYERAKDLIVDMDELRNLFRQDQGQLRGRLRVDMPLRVARDFVIRRLPEFLAAHPELDVELSSTDRRVDLVREGFDCVLRVGALSDSSLVARPIGQYTMMNVVSPDYIATWGTPHTLADLAQHRLIHYVPVLGARSGGFEYTDDDGKTHHLAMAGALTVNNSDAYLAACLSGLGIAQVPEVGLDGLLEGGHLVPVLPAHRAPAMPIHLLYANRRHLPRRVQVFMAWLTQIMGESLSGVVV
ncbi:LysR family transcriptional regulator [Viridibacterium curvum]|uniref:LysR family transcriptional regulator n=1 Tax=Viridibacterium curvum TaxID=1101404 RepID=A0ABP9QU94_9RHOO